MVSASVDNIQSIPLIHTVKLGHAGDVLHLKTFGQSLLILGSYKAVFDLMDRRSANYSDRPQTPMVEL